MHNTIGILIGIILIYVLGKLADSFLKRKIKKPEKPNSFTDEQWSMFAEDVGAPKWVGFFERIISFISFAIPEYNIIGFWFAFKVAAKWEVWKNLIQIPNEIEGIQPLVWYQAKKAFGSWLLSRFLVGTLINVIIGAVSVYMGRWIDAIIKLKFCG